MAPDTTPHSDPHTIEFFLADGTLAQPGQSFVLVPKYKQSAAQPRRFRRLGSLRFTR